MNKPRIVIAGTSSNSGKTTATCAILTLLKRRNAGAASLKCGPDYIDPMFHTEVLGIKSTNLDPYFCDGNLLRYLLNENAGSDITVIEGVMGYYDGTGSNGTANSTYTVASETGTPVILVVDAKGAAASILATIEGFANFVDNSYIKGVLFNRVSQGTYTHLCQLMSNRFGDSIIPVGYIPVFDEKYRIPSRHLGLVTTGEINNLSEILNAIADLCENTIDLDAIIRISNTAEELAFKAPEIPEKQPVTIAYAKDDAFCFLYPDTLRLFEGMGATLIPFSPLADETVPADADGLFLPGGYPELYTEQLENNVTTKESVKSAVNSGMPTIAECGGFQYLGAKLDGHEMCGVLPHESYNTEHLVRFGYIALSSQKDSLFGPRGTILKGHEFHYWDSTDCGSDFSCLKPNGKTWKSGVLTDTLYAGYPHLFLYQNIPAAESFYDKCLSYKEHKS